MPEASCMRLHEGQAVFTLPGLPGQSLSHISRKLWQDGQEDSGYQAGDPQSLVNHYQEVKPSCGAD